MEGVSIKIELLTCVKKRKLCLCRIICCFRLLGFRQRIAHEVLTCHLLKWWKGFCVGVYLISSGIGKLTNDVTSKCWSFFFFLEAFLRVFFLIPSWKDLWSMAYYAEIWQGILLHTRIHMRRRLLLCWIDLNWSSHFILVIKFQWLAMPILGWKLSNNWRNLPMYWSRRESLLLIRNSTVYVHF